MAMWSIFVICFLHFNLLRATDVEPEPFLKHCVDPGKLSEIQLPVQKTIYTVELSGSSDVKGEKVKLWTLNEYFCPKSDRYGVQFSMDGNDLQGIYTKQDEAAVITLDESITMKSQCNVTTNRKSSSFAFDPLQIPANMLSQFTIDNYLPQTTPEFIKILNDLSTNAATKEQVKIYNVPSAHDHVHSLPVDHFVACVNDKLNKKIVFEIEFCFVTKDAAKSLPAPSTANIPLRTLLKVYDPTEPVNDTSYIQLTEYEYGFAKDDGPDETVLFTMPPEGVYCSPFESETSVTMPTIPDVFSTSIIYIQDTVNDIYTIDVAYDAVNGVTSFTFDGVLADMKFTSGLNLKPKNKGSSRVVVQDLKSGYQFVLNADTYNCDETTPLPSEGGSFQIIDDLAALVTPSQFLLGYDGNFTYLGKRQFNDVPANVFAAEMIDEKTKEKTVFELYVTSSDSTVINTNGKSYKGSTLLQLKTFHLKDVVPTNSTQMFDDFSDGTGKQFLHFEAHELQNFNVETCWPTMEKSYIIEYKGGDVNSIVKEVGQLEMLTMLRLKIANMSDVEPMRMRVQHLTLVPSDALKKTATMLNVFVLDKIKGIDPTETVMSRPMLTAQEAINKLNESLKSDPAITIGVDIAKPITLTVVNSSVYEFRTFYRRLFRGTVIIHNDVTKEGYSGGSMAAVAIVMLIMGVVGGVAIAWYKWKRYSGIAYQVYE